MKIFLALDERNECKVRIFQKGKNSYLDFYIDDEYSLILKDINQFINISGFIYNEKDTDFGSFLIQAEKKLFISFFTADLNETCLLINLLIKAISSYAKINREIIRPLILLGQTFLTQYIIQDIIRDMVIYKGDQSLEKLFFLSIFSDRFKYVIKKEIVSFLIIGVGPKPGLMEFENTFYQMYGKYSPYEINDETRKRIFENLGLECKDASLKKIFGAVKWWTKDQLIKFCEDKGIYIKFNFNRREIINKINLSKISDRPRLEFLQKILEDDFLALDIIEIIGEEDIKNILRTAKIIGDFYFELSFKKKKRKKGIPLVPSGEKILLLHKNSELVVDLIEKNLAKKETQIKKIVQKHYPEKYFEVFGEHFDIKEQFHNILYWNKKQLKKYCFRECIKFKETNTIPELIALINEKGTTKPRLEFVGALLGKYEKFKIVFEEILYPMIRPIQTQIVFNDFYFVGLSPEKILKFFIKNQSDDKVLDCLEKWLGNKERKIRDLLGLS